MANLYFPQLVSGALAQYPIRKVSIGRNVINVLPDGSLILYPDPSAGKLVWQLGYAGLSATDLRALVSHFDNCQGRFHEFTFIDPTNNLLSASANLLYPSWQSDSWISVTPNVADPTGRASAFTVINTGQTEGEIRQTLVVPESYQYCFSLFALSALPGTLQLVRRSSSGEEVSTLLVASQWTRLVSSGRLTGSGDEYSVAMRLLPGQQIVLYGPQLEAQITPSRYRPTVLGGGIYPSAHWGVDELPVSADAPGLYSTVFSIETAI